MKLLSLLGLLAKIKFENETFFHGCRVFNHDGGLHPLIPSGI